MEVLERNIPYTYGWLEENMRNGALMCFMLVIIVLAIHGKNG